MSLRSRLLCLAFIATLLPASLLGWRFLGENETAISGAVRSLAQASDDVAATLEQRVQGTAQLHYGLTHSRVLDSAERDVCSAHLAAVREAYPQYTGIVTVLPSGQLHCDSLQSGRQVDLSDRSYVKQGLAGFKGILVEPTFGRLTGNAVLQVVYPARAETGELRFMLVASLNLASFSREARRQSLLQSAELVVIDAKGTVLAWAGDAQERPKPGTSVAGTPLMALAQAGGTGEVVGRDGRRWIWAVAHSPAVSAAGLRILLGQPHDVLVAAPQLHLRQGLLALTVAALMLFVGMWSLAEWGVRRPVARITSMVNDLGKGHLAARIGRPYSRGEIGGLMSALDSMADSLAQQRSAIDSLNHQLQEAQRREIDERRANEAQLSKMANFDSLTGLPNRNLFRDRLERALVRSTRTHQRLALMFLDIDRFKIINDSLGHDLGDRLLVAISAVLTQCLRGSDSVSIGGPSQLVDQVYRLGGDEFMILVEDVDSTAAAAIAGRILSALEAPIVVGEHELFTTASIGITMSQGSEMDLDALIKQADMAMYRSKELGRATFCFFEEAMNHAAIERQRLEVQLRQALERGEFQLHYQPKANIRTGEITGVEALLRWKPAGQPLVAPDRFIGILEETGLIVPVGAWVFVEACKQMMQWQAAGMPRLSIAVNVSARQLRDPGLVQHIATVLLETGLDAGQLEVELTESMLIEDTEMVRRILTELGDMGVSIAVDDFGTGQSSLRYLNRFKVDTLKIDRSFVKDTPGDKDVSAIATAVISLGHGLGMKVVAEGVETKEQQEFLRQRGCDQLQGYLLSRPLSAEAFASWLSQRDEPAASRWAALAAG